MPPRGVGNLPLFSEGWMPGIERALGGLDLNAAIVRRSANFWSERLRTVLQSIEQSAIGKKLIAWLRQKTSTQFHFVKDYERLVKRFVRRYPIDEAMERLVGGGYEHFGQIEAHLLTQSGLASGMRLVDLGCGSGRLSTALYGNIDISYLGIDIVQALLDYAKSRAPTFAFLLHRKLSIPEPDESVDMVTAFSLFTHLLQTETYTYLEESARVLKSGGKIVFSFLEFAEPSHWSVFIRSQEATKTYTAPHLNIFIERSAITTWALHLGLTVERFVSAEEAIWEGHALGQSSVVLVKTP